MRCRRAILRWLGDAQTARRRAAASSRPVPPVGVVLAVVAGESAGDPSAVSAEGYRGLMQCGQSALTTYQRTPTGQRWPVTWPQLKNPAHGLDQLTVGVTVLALCASYVGRWAAAAREPIWSWALVCYGWGIGHLRAARERAAAELGRAPTLGDLRARDPAPNGVPGIWRRARRLDAQSEHWRRCAGEPMPPARIAQIGIVVVAVVAAGVLAAWAAGRAG